MIFEGLNSLKQRKDFGDALYVFTFNEGIKIKYGYATHIEKYKNVKGVFRTNARLNGRDSGPLQPFVKFRDVPL